MPSRLGRPGCRAWDFRMRISQPYRGFPAQSISLSGPQGIFQHLSDDVNVFQRTLYAYNRLSPGRTILRLPWAGCRIRCLETAGFVAAVAERPVPRLAAPAEGYGPLPRWQRELLTLMVRDAEEQSSKPLCRGHFDHEWAILAAADRQTIGRQGTRPCPTTLALTIGRGRRSGRLTRRPLGRLPERPPPRCRGKSQQHQRHQLRD